MSFLQLPVVRSSWTVAQYDLLHVQGLLEQAPRARAEQDD